MKKIALILIIKIITITVGHSQIKWSDYSQSSLEIGSGHLQSIALIIALRKGNDYLWSIRGKSKHFYTLEKDSAFQRLRRNGIIARTTFDTARAQFFVRGVDPENAGLYQFRVMEYPSNRTLMDWHSIDRFTDPSVIKSSSMPKMAYLGGYRTSFGSMLVIDVREKFSNKILATSLVAWESLTPVITNVYTSETLDEFFKKLQYPWAPEKKQATSQSTVLKVPSTNTNFIFALKGNIFYKNQIQYQLIRNDKVYIPWRYNDYGNSFVWVKDCPPGIYVMKIRFSGQPLQNMVRYPFEVAPSWYQTNLFRIIVGIFTAAILGAFLFLIMFVQQNRKTREQQANNTKLRLELKSIYAQLNPHFVFNALSSIQGLINKQDIQGANNYLSDFARLMRESLKNSNKDEISLKEEVQTLNTYLKLEQLRFGFRYDIDVSSEINVFETGIPSLLLQPLIENAVKHGVSSLQNNGQIKVQFRRDNNSMNVIITDNGEGFIKGKSSGGVGLQLTKDRVNLLNKLNREQNIYFSTSRSAEAKTEVTLVFNNWFL